MTVNDRIIGAFLVSEFSTLDVQPEARLLDLGCGLRPYRKLYERGVRSSVGVDLSPSAPGDVRATAEKLPFPAATFDIVLATEVIEHTIDMRRTIAEVWRVLRPGGLLFITWPFLHPLHDTPADYSRASEFLMERVLLDAGMQIERLVRRGDVVMVMLTSLHAIVGGAGALICRRLGVRVLASLWETVVAGVFDAVTVGYWWIWRSSAAFDASRVGEGLRGFGARARWTLGYCVRARKAGP